MYKKSMICLIALFGLLQRGISQTEMVNFESGMTWKQILKQARAESKYIFVDCYATWCGPCKEMDRKVYTDEKVGDFFNEHFVCLKVQMDRTVADSDAVKAWYADALLLQNRYEI